MLDTHIHSNVSFDGICTRREMALASLKKGGSGLCFTDHYDVVDGSGALVPAYDWYPARQAHRETLEALPGDFMLLYGLELGNVTADFAAGDKALQEPGLDFVLGSIHNAGPAFHRQDYYFECFTSPEQCYTYLDEYFTQLEALTAWGNFDSLAHIPYPLRYMQERDGQPVSLERYAGCIDGLLCALIRRGQALEVNTNKTTRIMPEYGWLLDRYKKLGGSLVTVGTDAHNTLQAGQGLQEAYALLLAHGFDSVTCFIRRKPVQIKIATLSPAVPKYTAK